MEILHTVWIMMMIKTVLAQSDVDSTHTERIVTNQNLETANNVVTSEDKTITQGFEKSKNFTSNNPETRISNEIYLESNSSEESEEVIVKRSTVGVQSTETPSGGFSGSKSISFEDNLDAKLTTSDSEMGKAALTSSSGLLLQSHGDTSTVFQSTSFSDITDEESEGTVTDREEINSKSVLQTTSVSESTEAQPMNTKIPEAEDFVLKSLDSNVFRNENMNSNTFKSLETLHTDDYLNSESTSSDYSSEERAQTAPVDFSTSRTFKTIYSDFETSDTDGLVTETSQREPLQMQSTSGTLTSVAATENVHIESTIKNEDLFSKNFEEEEQSESRHSLSTAEAEGKDSDDGVSHGDHDHDHGSITKSETPREQSITNAAVTYTFREENENTQDLGFKTDDNAVGISYTVDEEDGKETVALSNTEKGIDNHAARVTEKTNEDEKTGITNTGDSEEFRASTGMAISEASDETSEDTVTELHERREDFTLSSSEISKSTDGTENNSTRIPKRIQEPRYTEARYRPRPPRPDPGYSYGDDRPYRPDDILYSRGQNPAVDSYTPLRRESDFSRPARPDPYVPASEFSRHSPDYSRQSSSDSGIPKPYRPQSSFARPYVPQGSFGRPYRPDRDHVKNVSPSDFYSKTTEEFPLSSKPDNTFFGASQSETDFSEPSQADDYDGKTSEASESEYQRPHSDIKPMVLTPDVFKPYRPPMDTRVTPDREDVPRPLRPIYLPSSSTVADSDISKAAVSDLSFKPASKPDTNDDISRNSSAGQSTKGGEKSRPSGSYPRPGFGTNYGQPIGTSPKPFTPGTITLSRNNLTRVEYIKADCFDNHMKVSIRFNGTFSGLVYSSGYSQDPTCSYINGSGRYHYEFFIRLNRCGTLGKQEVADQRTDLVTRRRQDRAQYLVNTVTVQYNPVIEEEIDEHFRVTCEYGYDFWKTVTFPVVSVESSALKVRTGSPVVFTLPPPQCNMEIRTGYGPSGSRVGGPVNVGDPLTLVIHMKSESASPHNQDLAPFDFHVFGPLKEALRSRRFTSDSEIKDAVHTWIQEHPKGFFAQGMKLLVERYKTQEDYVAGFDILVSNCFAHNGAQKRLQLIDSNGCVVQEKLVSPFRGVSSPERSQQVTLYSYVKAFRFTGSPALYIECDVHMCHGSCPPQRCYWRHLYKRSVENETATSAEDPIISESVSLFQSLEVRNEESDRPNSLAVSVTDGRPDEEMVCFRAAGFAAILASLLVLLVVACLTSICMCSRIRKMKTYFESTDTKHFMQFDINSQRK